LNYPGYFLDCPETAIGISFLQYNGRRKVSHYYADGITRLLLADFVDFCESESD